MKPLACRSKDNPCSVKDNHMLPAPSKVFLFLFLLLIMLACQIPSVADVSFLAPSSTPPFTFTPSFTPTLTAIPTTATLTLTPTETLTATPTATFAPPARRVLIFAIDGLRPDAILPAPMSNLVSLMQSGAYSMGAQTIFPSVTVPAFSSMLSGLCPSKHGADWNDYLPEKGYAQGTDLFDLAHAAGLRTDMYVGKRKLAHVTEPSSLDHFDTVDHQDSLTMERLRAEFPQDFGVLFVHLGETDEVGHEYGWLSIQQIDVIRRADVALGQLLAELDARNLRGETLIIVTSDHGGYGQGHGTRIREDMTIPWIAAGPGIQPKALTTAVHIMDTAATAAFALGLPIPAEWDGVPVYEAFGLPVERQSVQCEG
jgi:arylsulfatase A-like enzyme